MKTVYISNDGFQFESETDCAEHERKIKFSKYDKTIRGLNAAGKLIEYSSPNFMNEVFTIIYDTQEDFEELIENSTKNGMLTKGLKECGVAYAWDSFSCEWLPICDLIRKHRNEIRKLKERTKKVARN